MSTQNVRLSMRIKYMRSKASQLLVDGHQGWVSMLRHDLMAMKLPEQRETNQETNKATLVENGCLEVSWNTCINSHLYNTFYDRLVHSPADTRAKLLKSLSIRWVSLKDLSLSDPPPDPYTPRPRAKYVKMEVTEPILSLPLPGREPSIVLPPPRPTHSPQQTVAAKPVNMSATPSNSEMPRSVSTPTGLPHPDAEAIASDLPANRPKLKRTASGDISPLDRRPLNPGEAHLTRQLKVCPTNPAVPGPPSDSRTAVLPALQAASPIVPRRWLTLTQVPKSRILFHHDPTPYLSPTEATARQST
ncbi:hypothetical protein BD779DRAFT_1558981 [Infundibulicybe gibba]|nr:hypothetical protein BD779DRAFT_1558981 [Infundibulicybe gibba]